MSYSINSLTSDCYEGTTCLINKFGVKDESTLLNLETAVTLSKIAEYSLNPLYHSFDVDHYKGIHRFLFEDLYDWAGEYREVNMAKKGTKFAAAESIDDLMNKCFGRLRSMDYYQGLCFDEFIDNVVGFYCVTNIIHPFREGNGRTQRLFLSQLISFNGYTLDFSATDADELIIATIQASNGVTDNLTEYFKKAIKLE